MQFIAEYKMGPDASARLEPHRAAHLDYRMKLKSLRLAMQIHSPQREMIGSLLILDAETLAEAESVARADPYIAAGVYESVTVRPGEVRFCDLKAGPPGT
ncbi:MAG: hypothetical protein JNJ73_10850 [Hyphomonadaceae bacterium]|nr:hypothetical protein [Hyphomonadaceae bacterium]